MHNNDSVDVAPMPPKRGGNWVDLVFLLVVLFAVLYVAQAALTLLSALGVFAPFFVIAMVIVVISCRNKR